MAAVLGMNKTDFHIILLQSTIYYDCQQNMPSLFCKVIYIFVSFLSGRHFMSKLLLLKHSKGANGRKFEILGT
jgi:hypothetical protein